jgi:hypothetical protein
MSSIVLTPITEAGHWRIKMTWPNNRNTPRFFGRFETRAEAEKWIADHIRLTERRQEPTAFAVSKSGGI